MVKLADTNNAHFCQARDSSHPIHALSSSIIFFPASALHRRRLVEQAFIHIIINMNHSPGFVASCSWLSQYIDKCSNFLNNRDLLQYLLPLCAVSVFSLVPTYFTFISIPIYSLPGCARISSSIVPPSPLLPSSLTSPLLYLPLSQHYYYEAL